MTVNEMQMSVDKMAVCRCGCLEYFAQVYIIFLNCTRPFFAARFLFLYFLTWDYSDTTVDEDFNAVRLFNFLASPEISRRGHFARSTCN